MALTYPKSAMLYDDGTYYKWAAKADHDNPYYRGGKDHKELNRTEGYEVQYFIEHTVGKIKWNGAPTITDLKKVEKMIRYDVPKNLRAREDIYAWISANYDATKYP
jgi:hypothetical protein